MQPDGLTENPRCATVDRHTAAVDAAVHKGECAAGRWPRTVLCAQSGGDQQVKVRKLATACAAVAVAVTGCSSSNGEASVSVADTTQPKSEVDYPDQIDLGNGYELRVDLPDGAAAVSTDAAQFIMMRKGRDLSGLSNVELTKLITTGTEDEFRSGDVSLVLFQRRTCAEADTYRNEESSVDAVSPLNGQPLSYETTDLAKKIREGSVTGPAARGLENLYGSVFVLKLGGTPCKAMLVGTVKAKGAPESPLRDFPYQVLVEGEGVLTGPE